MAKVFVITKFRYFDIPLSRYDVITPFLLQSYKNFPLQQSLSASFPLCTACARLFLKYFIKKCAFALRVSYKFAIFAPVFRKESGSNITELPHRRRNEPNNIHKSVCALCAGVSAVNVGCGKPR